MRCIKILAQRPFLYGAIAAIVVVTCYWLGRRIWVWMQDQNTQEQNHYIQVVDTLANRIQQCPRWIEQQQALRQLQDGEYAQKVREALLSSDRIGIQREIDRLVQLNIFPAIIVDPIALMETFVQDIRCSKEELYQRAPYYKHYILQQQQAAIHIQDAKSAPVMPCQNSLESASWKG